MNHTNMYEIEPYEGIGPIKFGTSSEQLICAIGKPAGVAKNRLGESRYRYDSLIVTISNDMIVEVGFLPDANLQINGMKIFTDENCWRRLLKLDGRPYLYVGFLVLLNLGITLTGFHDGDESQKAVTVFSKGRWEGLLDRLRPFDSYV